MSAYFPDSLGSQIRARVELETRRILGERFGIDPRLIIGYTIQSRRDHDDVDVHLHLATPVRPLTVAELNQINAAAVHAASARGR